MENLNNFNKLNNFEQNKNDQQNLVKENSSEDIEMPKLIMTIK